MKKIRTQKEADRDAVKRVVQTLSRGNASLAQGNFMTEEDIKFLRLKLRGYDFRVKQDGKSARQEA